VTDVSRQVGFRSLGTFSRTFRDAVGEPPIGYRRRFFPSVEIRRLAVPGCYLSFFAA
jgi:AraC-like DNA-binding protein